MVIALTPVALFWALSVSSLKKSIKPTVVNDPQAALSQSLGALNGAYNQVAGQTLMAALRFSLKDSLQKSLMAPVGATPSVSAVGQAESKSNPSMPVWIVTNRAGKVLFDNLSIPKPTPPAASPAASKKNVTKGKAPQNADIHDWPGMDKVLSGAANVSGILSFQGSSYVASAVPVSLRSKIIGSVIAGVKIDRALLQGLKSAAANDVAFYSQGQTLFTGAGSPPSLRSLSSPSTVQSGPSSFLTGAFSPPGLDGKTSADRFILLQPIKQSLTVEGKPEKSLLKIGLLLALATLLCTVAFIWLFTTPFNRLLKAVDQITQGNFDVILPSQRPDEWGRMARSLEEMIESQRERERISLVLGKVVDPQAAKKILGEKDYFALKGERRECTLLQADLKAFNTLSENMAPEALVEALNQYFSVINEVVFKYEGMLDKFIGETAIAVWGAPFAHEDKEERAAKTALEIQEALKTFNISRIKKGHPPFTVGIGIHTGPVVAGNLGSNKRFDYSIIGEPLHVVNRLCSMAAPGQTIVSDETFEKIKTEVKANALNPIAVKGSMEPLKTFEITQWL